MLYTDAASMFLEDWFVYTLSDDELIGLIMYCNGDVEPDQDDAQASEEYILEKKGHRRYMRSKNKAVRKKKKRKGERTKEEKKHYKRNRLRAKQTAEFFQRKSKTINTVKEGLKFYEEELEDDVVVEYKTDSDSEDKIVICDTIVSMVKQKYCNNMDIADCMATIERYQQKINFLLARNEELTEKINQYKKLI